MTFPLNALPPEIINAHVLMFLSADDIVSLSECVPVNITREVYNNAFHDNSDFPHFDLEMFKRRARARLYVMGNTNPSVGDFVRDFPQNYEQPPNTRVRRMHTPWRIENVGTLAQVGLENRRLAVVTSGGELFFSKTTAEHPYTLHRAETRLEVEDEYGLGRKEAERIAMLEKKEAERRDEEDEEEWDEDEIEEMDSEEEGSFISEDENEEEMTELRQPVPEASSQLKTLSDKVFAEPPRQVNIVQIVCSFVTYGLDDQGVLWKWNGNELEGTRICLKDAQTGLLITGKILQLKEGAEYFTCFVDGVGIVTLVERLRFSPEKPNGVRSGYRCLDDHLCYSQVDIVPGTNVITDYVVTEFGTVFLKPDGTVGAVGRTADYASVPAFFESLNKVSPFTKLYGSDSRVYLVIAEGPVVQVSTTGDVDDGNFELSLGVVPLPSNTAVASIAVTQQYCMILTTEGDVYSWGMELNYNGSMGLGRFEDAVQIPGVSTLGLADMMVANIPVRVPLPGRVYAVFASRMHSAVLMDE